MASTRLLVAALFTACVISSALATDVDDQQVVLKQQPVAIYHDSASEAYSDKLQFQLKHIFHRGGHKYPDLHRRLDIDDTTTFRMADGSARSARDLPEYTAKRRPILMQRLANRPTTATYHHDATLSSTEDAWTEELVSAPDATDRDTVLSFAKMAYNSYIEEAGSGEWKDVGMGFNFTGDFGWEDDGIRGHIYGDKNNKTIVIAMKGTSLPFKDGWGTISNDKTNDNLLFSCCCGQGRWLWQKVCSCQTDTNTCNSTCLTSEIQDKTQYYYKTQELYHNVSRIYPHSDIWMTGHSLGGAVASLVGLAVGRPVITFEAPGEAMAATRLGIPKPPNRSRGMGAYARANTGGYHFGHTADDIFMGNCNALSSICTIAGYAMETKCHSGYECVYDTVKDKGWSPNARKWHGIGTVLEEVYEAYDKLPSCKMRTQCDDCNQWNFTKAG